MLPISTIINKPSIKLYRTITLQRKNIAGVIVNKSEEGQGRREGRGVLSKVKKVLDNWK